MAAKKKAAPEPVEATPEAAEEPAVNPAIDPNLSAEERLQALDQQHAAMRAEQGHDYPV